MQIIIEFEPMKRALLWETPGATEEEILRHYFGGPPLRPIDRLLDEWLVHLNHLILEDMKKFFTLTGMENQTQEFYFCENPYTILRVGDLPHWGAENDDSIAALAGKHWGDVELYVDRPSDEHPNGFLAEDDSFTVLGKWGDCEVSGVFGIKKGEDAITVLFC